MYVHVQHCKNIILTINVLAQWQCCAQNAFTVLKLIEQIIVACYQGIIMCTLRGIRLLHYHKRVDRDTGQGVYSVCLSPSCQNSHSAMMQAKIINPCSMSEIRCHLKISKTPCLGMGNRQITGKFG